MVVGFNHNFRYKGEVYHIQTEDSGVRSPNIVTLLYQGGTILASKKTSYADIAKVDNLDQVVEELMKEQHKEMLRSLKAGEFDAVISTCGIMFASRPEAAAAELARVTRKGGRIALTTWLHDSNLFKMFQVMKPYMAAPPVPPWAPAPPIPPTWPMVPELSWPAAPLPPAPPVPPA